MWQQTLAVLFVLGLLAGTLLLLRKNGFARFPRGRVRARCRNGQIQVLDRAPLTAQHALFLIQVRSNLVLVGVSPSGCNRIMGFVEGAATADAEDESCTSV